MMTWLPRGWPPNAGRRRRSLIVFCFFFFAHNSDELACVGLYVCPPI